MKQTIMREALLARRWAISLLTAPPERRSVPSVPRIAARSWSVFFAIECCALPVAQRIRRVGGGHLLDRGLMGALGEAELVELQRVMTARAQLRALDAIALANGFSPVVLKGGAAAPSHEPVDLGDIDLLFDSPSAAKTFATLLERDGYSSLTADPEEVTTHHLSGRTKPGCLRIELHIRADYGSDLASTARVGPLGVFRACRQFSGPGELARLVRHSVVVHPYRQGHLRDVVLMSQVMRSCTPSEIDVLRSSLAVGNHAPAELALLDLVRSVCEHREAGGTRFDPFAGIAVARYELSQERHPVWERLFPGYPGLLLMPFDGWRQQRQWIASRFLEAVDPMSPWSARWLHRLSPVAADVVGRITRIPYRVAQVGLVVVVGSSRMRRARRVASASSASLTQPPVPA